MSEYLPNTLFTFTSKQRSDFVEFKKYFRYSTEEQQSKIPEKIRIILLDWKENLKEYITICTHEYTNDFDCTWIYEIPQEHIDMISIEEAKIHTYQILDNMSYQNKELKKENEELKQRLTQRLTENEELKQKIQELEEEKKIAENKLKHIVNYVSNYENMETSSTNTTTHPTRQYTINTFTHMIPPSQQQPLSQLKRQFANRDDELPQNYWDTSIC